MLHKPRAHSGHRIGNPTHQQESAVPVEVRLPTVLRTHAGGKSSVFLQGETVGEVISDLTSKFPGLAGQVVTEDGTLHRFVNVYVNDDDIRYIDKLDTKVSDGDVISILPAVAGGAVAGGAVAGGAVAGGAVAGGAVAVIEPEGQWGRP